MDSGNVKKFLVISDIHGNIKAVECLVRELEERVDGVLCLGDLGCLSHDIILENYERGKKHDNFLRRCNAIFNQIIETLKIISSNIYIVPGNHDQVWLTDRNCYDKIKEVYGVKVVHNRVFRIAENLVIAGAGGTTATFDESERRIAGWPFDEQPKAIGMTTEEIKCTGELATCWNLRKDFDYDGLKNPKMMECYCKASPDKDIDHSSESYIMARDSLRSIFFREYEGNFITKFQEEVVKCEQNMIPDDSILNFIGSSEYKMRKDSPRTSEERVKHTDSVIILLHQAPINCLTGCHLTTKCVKQFFSEVASDSSPNIDIVCGLPRRCGSTAISEALDEILSSTRENIVMKSNRNDGTTRAPSDPSRPVCNNVVCAMNGHTHRPSSTMGEYHGVEVYCPGALVNGSYLIVTFKQDKNGVWHVEERTYRTFSLKDCGQC